MPITDIISDIYKRFARWIRMSEKQVNQVSGHSVRVGATQDPLGLTSIWARDASEADGSQLACRCVMERSTCLDAGQWRAPQRFKDAIVERSIEWIRRIAITSSTPDDQG